jgi:uncharacterized protein
LWFLSVLLVCALSRPLEAQPTPAVAHHQHLLSPALAALWSDSTQTLQPFDAADLIAQLDAVGIERAVVLSVAYAYGDPRRQVADEYARVREENDWTVAQAARFPDRLIAFCGVSPLREYAVEEVQRCARDLNAPGIKLHFGNSDVDLHDQEHVRLVARVFEAANALRGPIVVHLRTRSQSYGRPEAEVFLERILAEAPDVPVQVAHFAGSGPGYPRSADDAMSVFSEAIATNDARVQRLYFDVTTIVTRSTSAENAALVAQRIREIGAQRVLFGTDLSIGPNPPPLEAWSAFRELVPLSEDELRTIADNIAPYLR